MQKYFPRGRPVSRGALLIAPACEEGRGSGHIVRCIKLVQALRGLGREAWLYLPHGNEKARRIGENLGFDFSWVSENASFCTKASWEWVVLDRFQTSPAEFLRWKKLAPLIGIDEGGPCRDRFDFLIDILPNLFNRYAKPGKNVANFSGPSLLHLPPKPHAPASGFNTPLKILVSFGQEDLAGLGAAVARKLGTREQGTESKITNNKEQIIKKESKFLPFVTCYLLPVISPTPFLNLHEYDLLITHFGITAFEALYAGIPVLLLSPTAYHEKLAQAAGFYSAGIGRKNAAKLVRLLFKKNVPNVSFIGDLKKRCAALAARYSLNSEPKQSLALLINHMEPYTSRNCPVCGAALNGKAVSRHPDRSYWRCPACGIIAMYRSSPPPVEYGKEYFFELYKKQYGKTYIEDFPNLVKTGKRRLTIIQKLLGKAAHQKPSLLDIGCAYGPFLVAAKELGFSPLGIDPARDAVRYVTETLSIPAIHGPFPECFVSTTPHSPLPTPFNIITLWYVIEHFRDCVSVLAEIRKLLKPGGIVAFATPSFSGVSGRASLERFLEQSPADHWTVWSPRMCKKALQAHGFYVKKIVVTGHHPERFPVIGKFARNTHGVLYKMLMGLSKLFSLGDTFEVYAVKVG